MSVMLPGYLSNVLNWLGFPWPNVDEDQLREAADAFRIFARDLSASVDTTHRIMTVDVPASYSSDAYATLLRHWTTESRTHLDVIVDGCALLAGAFDGIAEGVAVMKGEVVAQLAIAAAEFLADQAAAVATFGLAEAALPILLAAQNRILTGIVQRFEQEVLAVIVSQTVKPVKQRVMAAVNQLLYPQLAHVVTGGTAMSIDTDAVRAHADAIGREGDGAEVAGQKLFATLSRLTFVGGG